MTESRISTLMIDCLDDQFEASLAFWSAALNMPVARRPSASQRYVTLGTLSGPLFVRLQRVRADAGVHLDIECRSPAAERRRLEALGARVHTRVKSWWVMEDPSGTRFCLIRRESGLL